jgi:hypothetical protein
MIHSLLLPLLSVKAKPFSFAFQPQSTFTVFSKNGYKPPGYESSSAPLSDGPLIEEYGKCPGVSGAPDIFSHSWKALSDYKASVQANLARFQV